jgi:hypothetical protein
LPTRHSSSRTKAQLLVLDQPATGDLLHGLLPLAEWRQRQVPAPDRRPELLPERVEVALQGLLQLALERDQLDAVVVALDRECLLQPRIALEETAELGNPCRIDVLDGHVWIVPGGEDSV